MRSMLAKGAFVLGGAGALLSSAPAGAEIEPSRCEPVYQEFEQAPDRRLHETMSSMYHVYGVEVHVQFLGDGKDEKIVHTKEAGGDEARDYLARMADECDWSDDYLGIAVVRSPRVYGVVTEGAAHEKFPDDIVKGKAEEKLIENLGDTSTTLQADVEQYLQDIQEAEQSAEIPDWLLVGGLATGALVAAGVGYWLTRGGGSSGGGGYGSASYISMSISSGDFGSSSGGTGGGY